MKEKIEFLFDKLWPINRSLTGNGNRKSIALLQEMISLNIHEIPSGTKCLDWIIPEEWNVNEAWIKDELGNTIVDFSNNNLHLMGYSEPIKKMISYEELVDHLYYIEKQQDWIPYKTSYYKKQWGFCLTWNMFKKLDKQVSYEVYIESEFKPNGSMTIGDKLIKGISEKEILFSTYICHPSMANNELSGPLVTSFIQKEMENRGQTRFSYRFVYCPETIGTIQYLSMHGKHLTDKLVAGFVVTTVGDDGNFTFKRSKAGNTLSDRAALIVLSQDHSNYVVENFSPSGSDERQYCSPGFNLPVSSLMRTRYLNYEEYHTSADNKSFISFQAMEETVNTYLNIINVLENNFVFKNLFPYGEPQLGKRGLYSDVNSDENRLKLVLGMKWILSLSDEKTDLISMITRSGIHYSVMIEASKLLLEKKLIKIVDCE